jgi:hypothetical protein
MNDTKCDFNGKKVLVIGSAKESEREFDSVDLKEIDLIIRMNNSINFPFFAKDQSCFSRIDILACSTIKEKVVEIIRDSKNNLKRLGVKHILLVPYASIDKNLLEFLEVNSISILSIPSFFYQKTKHKLNGNTPTTGFAILDFLFSQNLASLYIIGYSFFKTEYIDGYNSVLFSDMEFVLKKNCHSPTLEISQTQELINRCNYQVILGKNTFEALYS